MYTDVEGISGNVKGNPRPDRIRVRVGPLGLEPREDLVSDVLRTE